MGVCFAYDYDHGGVFKLRDHFVAFVQQLKLRELLACKNLTDHLCVDANARLPTFARIRSTREAVSDTATFH